MTEDLYKEYILELYRNPQHAGRLNNPDVTYTEYNPSCGDEITVDLKIDASGKITEIKHSGQGCAIAIAAMSLMSGVVNGKDKAAVLALSFEDVQHELGVSVGYTRKKCAMLGLRTIQHAIRMK